MTLDTHDRLSAMLHAHTCMVPTTAKEQSCLQSGLAHWMSAGRSKQLLEWQGRSSFTDHFQEMSSRRHIQRDKGTFSWHPRWYACLQQCLHPLMLH